MRFPWKSVWKWLVPLLYAAGPFIGLALVVSIFSIDSEVRQYFLTGGNFKIILTQTVIVAIGALGMTMVIVSGGIDLSVGSVVALTSVVAATLILQGWHPLIVIVLTIGVGGLIGLFNGGVISALGMVPFIVTLGMMGIARGMAKWLAKSQTVNPPENWINGVMALSEPRQLFPLPMGVWVALGLAALMTLVMGRTVFGRYVFAIGSNESAARLCGIRVRWYKLGIYGLAGMFTGLAGLMQFSRLTQGDPSIAIGLELDIIAAVVIGALIMAILRNGSNQMGWPVYVQEIIIGSVIIIAVALDKLRQRRAD